MKRFSALIILLLTTSFLASQNDILGDWFLHYYSKNDVIQYGPNANSYLPATFSNGGANEGQYLLSGLICGGNTGYGVDYDYVSNNTISFQDVYTLANCNESAGSIFLALGVLSNKECTYEITGSGINKELKIINPDGDYVIFGKYNISNENLLGLWYLNYITANGEQLNNNSSDITINLTLNEPLFILYDGYECIGNLICNEYSAIYYIRDLNNLAFNYTNTTSNTCSNENETNYESLYKSIILNTNQANGEYLLNFEVSTSGSNLTLTNPNTGNSATFGKEPLSLNQFHNNTVQLTSNPVSNELTFTKTDLILNKSFQIFSIDGKLINKGLIKSNKISVNNLNQGLYFLKIDDLKPIRFIKL